MKRYIFQPEPDTDSSGAKKFRLTPTYVSVYDPDTQIKLAEGFYVPSNFVLGEE